MASDKGFVAWGDNPLELKFGLSDPIQFKDDPERKGIIICVHAAFSGVMYEVCEFDGTITPVDGEEIEPVTKRKLNVGVSHG